MKSPFALPFVVAALAAACSGRPATGDAGPIGGAGGGTFTPTNKLDLLFVVDDSGLMISMQQNLLRNFPTFMTTLRNAATPPDLHIAVVSTDLGAGDGSIASCDATGGKNGIFQNTPRGTCTDTGLAAGATYIIDNGDERNYTGALEDVFTCVAYLGETGCGFERPLAAMARALGADGQPPPVQNQEFLRPDAILAVVFLSNEDDCSAPPGSALFLGPDAVDAPYGLLGGYRCREFGNLCNGAPPPRLPPGGDVTAVVTLDGCVSAEYAGALTPVSEVFAQLRSLKQFPDQQIAIATIAGPAAPYSVHWLMRPGQTAPAPHMADSCTITSGTSVISASPAVRLAQFAQAFGPNGLVLPACSDNYGPSLQQIGELLNRAP